ncbi:hypothetical protein LP123_13015 [Moraxella bovis]|uniref:Uncharacterized protein n=1 Tax=Moraxella bovis TaxID=476 RepID=A0AAQ2QAL2_MORBO|nr:hypothetical protein [Moraxella bovis]AWY19290.1 hypothetical protein DQF64_01295 [Moraxella bovis]OOR88953.1 hypothetical protein B0182_08620 [Moraxella bovis]UYZ76005.1 hypothetical protein LP093_01310 [Moraxella bovis]UYZ78042.1 hypothetical protein LP115_12485 [Moraxella bovis]UYZ80937.1 hypothetical protein LP113_13165 [Moraxella bovis]
MKYCQDYPYYDLQDNFSGNFYIIKSIHELICKDDDSGKEAYIDDDTPIFSDEWLALDLDALERELSQKRTDKNIKNSMDMGFVVSDGNNKAFVLVEMRYNFLKFNNITRDDLNNKVYYSTICVKNTLNIKIYTKKYFLFAKNKVEQGRNRLNRMNPECSPDYETLGTRDLYELFFQ